MELKILVNGTVRFGYVFPDDVSMDALKRCVEILQKKPDPSDILDRRDYVAAVLWTREDIAECLKEKGFEGNEENINRVVESGWLDALNDCSDVDWNVIFDAIDNLVEAEE